MDSIFNVPLDHCLEILEEIVRRPWRASFSTMGVSPRHLDDSLLKLMWRAGFRSFMTTPESAAPAMLRHYQKSFTRDDVIQAAEAINRSRFKVFWYFLIGGPGEDNHTLQETLDFVTRYLHRDRHPPYHLAHFYLGVRTYPGTRLWEIAREEGYLPRDHNPLQQIWYLSETLDLDLAVRQLNNAACRYPEVILGSSEKFFSLSKIWLCWETSSNGPRPIFTRSGGSTKPSCAWGSGPASSFGTRRIGCAPPCGSRGTGGLSFASRPRGEKNQPAGAASMDMRH